MKPVKCANGHYYDGDAYRECPHCAYLPPAPDVLPERIPQAAASIRRLERGRSGRPEAREEQTMMPPVDGAGGTRFSREDIARGEAGGGLSNATPHTRFADGESANVTIQSEADAADEPGDEPAADVEPVGWLVCVEGRRRGAELRLTAGENRLTLEDADDVGGTVELHILYDAATREFLLAVLPNASETRLNGKMRSERTRLCPYDTIEQRGARLIFVPLCGNQFGWPEGDRRRQG